MRRFMFYLATQLGCTVNELLARLSSAELTEWMAYYLLQKMDEETDPAQSAAAQIARMKAAGHG